jgi:predicted alpha/beta-hydrolase family hydrolase
MGSKNQTAAREGSPKPSRTAWRPRFPIDRRTVLGRRVARFEQDLVATVTASNKRRPPDAEQQLLIRRACAFEALIARLEGAMLVGASMDHRALSDAVAKRDEVVNKLTGGPFHMPFM